MAALAQQQGARSFRGHNILEPGHPDALFSSKKSTTFFSSRGQRSDMVKFLFSVHTITEAKQSNRQGGVRAVDLPAKSFDLARTGVAPL